jgi:hypothetical protein
MYTQANPNTNVNNNKKIICYGLGFYLGDRLPLL